MKRSVSVCCVLLLLLMSRTDLRAQWQIIRSFDAHITCIYFLDGVGQSRAGFVGLANGTVWQTNDGGATWLPCNTPGLKGVVTSFSFKDARTGWLSARPGPKGGSACYITQDGGATWSPLNPTGDLPCVYFNRASGRLFLTSITTSALSSRDGGTTFSSWGPNMLNGIAFNSNLIGFTTCYSGAAKFTNDGGISWNNSTFTDYSTMGSECWNPLAIPGTLTFFAISENTGSILRSSDAGQTWKALGTLPKKPTGDIRGTCEQLYAQSDSGIFCSNDEGYTWYSVGGPGNESDVRFYTVGTTVYASNYYNSLYVLADALRPYKGRIGVDTKPLASIGCNPVDARFDLHGLSACFSTVLLGIDVQSPQNITATSKIKFPHLLLADSLDTMHVRYIPSGNLADTLKLTLHFRVGSQDFDSLLTIIASKDAKFDATPFPASLDLKVRTSCYPVEGAFELRNGKCDSLTFISAVSSDPTQTFILSPTTSYAVGPLGIIPIRIRTSGDHKGSSSSIITLTLSSRGSTYTISYPVSLNVLEEGEVRTAFNPRRVDFGPTSLCSQRTSSFYVQNPGCGELEVEKIAWLIASPSITLVSQPTLPSILTAGAQDTIIVRYAPVGLGNSVAVLGVTIKANGVDRDTTIQIQGSSYTISQARLSTDALHFDSVLVCEENLDSCYIRNESCDSTELTEVLRPNEVAFGIDFPKPQQWLRPGDSVLVRVRFSATNAGASQATGARSDVLRLRLRNAGGSEQELDLGLDGYILPSVHKFSVTPSAINYTLLDPCTTHDTLITITNLGTCDTICVTHRDFVGSNWFTAPDSQNVTYCIAPGESHSLIIRTTTSSDSLASATLRLWGINFDTTIRLRATTRSLTSAWLSVVQKDTAMVAKHCQTTVRSLVYRNRSCEQLTIDSLVLLAAGASQSQFDVTVVGSMSLPVIVAPGDSLKFNVIFDADGTGDGRIVVHLHASGDKPCEDIVITGKAVGNAQLMRLGVSAQDGTATMHANPGANVEVIVRTNSSIADSLGLAMIETNLKFADNELTPLGATGANGWQVNATNGTGNVALKFTRSTLAAINAGDELGRVKFYSTIGDQLSSNVWLSGAALNGGDSAYARCVLASLPATDTVLVKLNIACGDSIISGFIAGRGLVDLLSIRPDPIRSTATFTLNVRADANVRLEIYDAMGRSVRVVSSGLLRRGAQKLIFEASNLPSGVYYARLSDQSSIRTYPIILSR